MGLLVPHPPIMSSYNEYLISQLLSTQIISPGTVFLNDILDLLLLKLVGTPPPNNKPMRFGTPPPNYNHASWYLTYQMIAKVGFLMNYLLN